MKLFLEEESELADGSKTISKIKEVVDKEEAKKDKTLKKCFLHTCYHDEGNNRPCKREVI